MKKNSRIIAPLIVMLVFNTSMIYAGWIKTYGCPLGNAGFWVEPTSDEGYIISAIYRDSSTTQDKSNPTILESLYFIKTDSAGDTL